MPAPEHALPYPTYLDHLRSESARFRAVLADCDPSARVPACPDWDASDLVWHLAEVQLFWAKVIRHRPASPDDPEIAEEPTAQRPESYAELLELFDDFSHALTTELERADPGDAAWHWEPDQLVATSFRRQAHEALIHRVDAEQTAGLEVGPIETSLAADGVLELMEVMYGGEVPDWLTFTPTGQVVGVELTDVGQTLNLAPGTILGTSPEGKEHDGPHLMLTDPDAPAAATVSGTAAGLDVWLWHRRDDGVEVSGDRAAYDTFLAAVTPPLD